ncbi:MAG TPA: carbohydrate ABC transporter permease [Acidimicrobiales bacterium]|nr:carbohydrate ABC transporter permease [Acidimicrobiales bacterium]
METAARVPLTSSAVKADAAAGPRRRWGLSTPAWIVLLLALLFVILAPLYWMVLVAFRSNADLFAVPPKVLPTSLDPGVVWRAVSDTPIASWLWNSTLVSVPTTALATALGVPAGYALSRVRSRTTGVFAGGVLVTQMLPPLLLLVPLFVIFQHVSLINSRIGLILADTATILPLSIWMSKGMIDGVPAEIDDAAFVDGCTSWRTLISIIVPIVRSGLAAVAIYGFIETWNEFLFAKTLLVSSSKWPASVGLYSFQGQNTTPTNEVMMAALIFSVPAIILFFVVRRGLVVGMTAGAVKG